MRRAMRIASQPTTRAIRYFLFEERQRSIKRMTQENGGSRSNASKTGRPSERQNERAGRDGFWRCVVRHVDRKCAESSPARVLTLQLIHVQYCFQSPVRGEVTRCASRRLVMCNRNTNRTRHRSLPEAESVRIQLSIAMNLKITVAPRFLSSFFLALEFIEGFCRHPCIPREHRAFSS